MENLFKLGNLGAVLAQYGTAMDMVQTYTDDPNQQQANKNFVCYRYDPKCKYNVQGPTAPVNAQCVAKCNLTAEQATGVASDGESLLSSVRTTTAAAAKPFLGQMTLATEWAAAFNIDVNSWSPTTDAKIDTYVASLSLTTSKGKEQVKTSFKAVSKTEDLVGWRGAKIDDYRGMTYLLRCMYMETLTGDLVEQSCPVSMKAFGRFFGGFTAVGVGLVGLGIAHVFAMCCFDGKKKKLDYID